MNLQELFEAPDFDYTKFNNRDEELKKFTWKIFETGDNVHALAYQDINHKLGQISAFRKNDSSLIVIYASIDNEWKGSGLGQMLYDKLIEWAKNHKFKYFRSDDFLSRDGQHAWKRLSKRYPVQAVTNPDKPLKPFYQINLNNVKSKISESPDFDYAKFRNKDAKIAKLIWSVDNDTSSGGLSIDISARLPYGTSTAGFINASSSYDHPDCIQIARAQIGSAWFGTGLGQILYDKLIAEAKKAGFRYLMSDVDRSDRAMNAWERISMRYPVRTITMKNGDTYDRIDLSKVALKEAPDFGYKHFVDKDSDILELEWKIKSEGKDGFIVTAAKKNYDEPSKSIHGHYEAILIARPTDFDVLRDGESFQQTGNGIQISYAALSKQSKDYWRSTGLGQMIYDKAIEYAKKCGYDFFESDYDMSPYARKAWEKLAKRYPVKKVKEFGKNIFRIDLNKINKVVKEDVNDTPPEFRSIEDNGRGMHITLLSINHRDKGWICLSNVDPTGDNLSWSFDVPENKAEMVSDVQIDPIYRGKGYGLALYHAALKDAKSRGVQLVISGSPQSNDALRIWNSLAREGKVKKNSDWGMYIDLRDIK